MPGEPLLHRFDHLHPRCIQLACFHGHSLPAPGCLPSVFFRLVYHTVLLQSRYALFLIWLKPCSHELDLFTLGFAALKQGLHLDDLGAKFASADMLQADKGPLFLFDNLVLTVWIRDFKDTAGTCKRNGAEGVARTLSANHFGERPDRSFCLFELSLQLCWCTNERLFYAPKMRRETI